VDEESLAELQRRAYSRPGADAVAAQRELAELTAPVEPLPIPELSETHPVAPRVIGALVAAIVLVSAAALAVPPVPTATSLEVFDAPMAADAPAPTPWIELATRETEGAGMTYAAETLRYLGTIEEVQLWAWRSSEGRVCLGMFDELRGGGSTCTSLETFRQQGLTLGTGGQGVGMSSRTAHWGPDGDPEVTTGFG